MWCCFCGTEYTEGSHGQFTREFGNKRAGPMYSVSVLLNHHFCQSWRESKQHWPNFPTMIHYYNGALVDSITALYLRLFGILKYAGWPNFDKGVPQCISLPLGQPQCWMSRPCLEVLLQNTQRVLLCTPMATKEERILFKRLVKELLAKGWYISSDDFFSRCVSAGMRCM